MWRALLTEEGIDRRRLVVLMGSGERSAQVCRPLPSRQVTPSSTAVQLQAAASTLVTQMAGQGDRLRRIAVEAPPDAPGLRMEFCVREAAVVSVRGPSVSSSLLGAVRAFRTGGRVRRPPVAGRPSRGTALGAE
jgi:hypothetical protein